MRFVTPNINVEVKYKKAANALLVPKPPIKLKVDGTPVQEIRVVGDSTFLWKGHGKTLATETKFIDPETQKEVPSSEVLEVLSHYAYKVVDPSGDEVDKEKIEYYAVQPDGSEVQVRPFDRTEEINVPEPQWVPSTSIEPFRITNVYELFSEKESIAQQLFDEAEKRLRADQVGVTTFSFGNGFIQFYAFLVPMVREGRFIWLLKLSDTKDEYVHMQDIPSKVKIPIREVPTLSTLPPVQALVMTVAPPKKRKKE